jgi:hypothetical protein
VANDFEDAPRRAFDVFLAYNSRDENATGLVRGISSSLEERGVRAWFAEKDSIAGVLGTKAMVGGIDSSRCSAIFHGAGGLGRWQGGLEAAAAIQSAVEETGRRAFAVLLPDSGGIEALPIELRLWTVLDLREGFSGDKLTEEGLIEILAAVEGVSPREYREHNPAGEMAVASTNAIGVSTGRNRALLVGVSQYDDAELQRLHGPHNDVVQLDRALSEARMSPGQQWEITKCVEPDYQTLQTALTTFFGAEDAHDDTVLFYYSGHGLVTNDSMLFARNTQVSSPTFSSVSGNQIVALIRECKARAKVVILDCCHAAPLSAPHNAYADLGADVAVVFASRGPTDDAAVVSEASPFTCQLVAAMRDPAAYGDAGLTVGDLVRALAGRGQKPWTSEQRGHDIVLMRWVTEAVLPLTEDEQGSPPISVEVSPAFALSDRLPLIRQLSETLDAVLAVAGAESEIPQSVVRRSITLLGRELRDFVLSQDDLDEIYARARENPDRPATLDVSFSDPHVQAQLADVPWEYLALCPDEGGMPPVDDAMRAPPLSVERVTATTRKKQVARASIQQVTIFSSLGAAGRGSVEHHQLTATTKQGLDACSLSSEVVSPGTWSQFLGQEDNADVLILHAPVYLVDGNLSVGFAAAGPAPELKRVPASSLRDRLKAQRALTWLFIETVASDPGNQTAFAVRRLAEELASNLERPVVAVCHARAYATALSEDAHAATPFLVHLLTELGNQRPLDQAAHAARRTTVSTLAPDEPAIVGIPIVIRPEPRPEGEPARRPTSRP